MSSKLKAKVFVHPEKLFFVSGLFFIFSVAFLFSCFELNVLEAVDLPYRNNLNNYHAKQMSYGPSRALNRATQKDDFYSDSEDVSSGESISIMSQQNYGTNENRRQEKNVPPLPIHHFSSQQNYQNNQQPQYQHQIPYHPQYQHQQQHHQPQQHQQQYQQQQQQNPYYKSHANQMHSNTSAVIHDNHKCRIWIPDEALSKYPRAGIIQLDHSKMIHLIEICCEGYGPVRWRGNTKCYPLCDNCENGSCVAPGKCECYEGYIRNDNGDCVFTCPLGCLNGRCYLDGSCQCDPGYKLDETRKFCRPICSGGCGSKPGHNCTEPEVCGCAKGYRLTDTGCEPTCQPECGRGVCTEANYCKCDAGYTFRDNVCQSDCYQKCDNGICYSRNRCICKPGFTYHERTSQCIPN